MYRIGNLSKVQFAKKRIRVQSAIAPEQLLQCNALYLICQKDNSGFLLRTGVFFRHSDSLIVDIKNFEILDRLNEKELYEVYVRDDQIVFDEEKTPELLEGYEVYTEEGRYIGIIFEIIENPAHPLIEIQNDGSSEYDGVLIPLVREFIVRKDRKKRRLYMCLPDGLI